MRAQLQIKRNAKLWLGMLSGGVILALSSCALSPLAEVQPSVSDSLAIENRQLRSNDSWAFWGASRRGGQRTSDEGATVLPEDNDKAVIASATPSINVNAARSVAVATQIPQSRAVAKIVPKQAPVKIAPKLAASGNGATIVRPPILPSPTPVRAIGGGEPKPMVTPSGQPQPTATATVETDIFDPANSPYATQPVARNEASPTPKYPSGPVIYLPGKVLPTPVSTAAIVPTLATPKAIPTNIANNPPPIGYGKETGAGAAASPTPKVLVTVTPMPTTTLVLK